MKYAITPRGAGNPVGVRAVEDNWPLAAGETFTVASPPANAAVLADDLASLRAETVQDRTARKGDFAATALTALLQDPDPETQLLARVVVELVKDMAAQKGRTVPQYRNDLLMRIV